jgi:lambda family phage portal protein
MGIEFDVWRRPVAYWISKRDPYLDLYAVSSQTTDWERVPAEDLYFGFDKERAYQSRGVPWFAASMLRLKMLSGYEEAALVNSRASAAKMGFLYSEEGQGEEYEGDDKDSDGNVIEDADPGRIVQLPPGVKFQGYTPEFPNTQHEGFVRSALRAIASGLSVAAPSLSGDLSDVNYSSIRAGIAEERENYKEIQEWMIEVFMEKVFADWLEMALLKSAIKLPAEKFDKYNKPAFSGRRWGYVDPDKDIDAKTKEIQAGGSTLTRWLAEGGYDLMEVLQERAREKDLAESLGLRLTINEPPKASQPTNGQATPAQLKALIHE